jgi:hypothetical protein
MSALYNLVNGVEVPLSSDEISEFESYVAPEPEPAASPRSTAMWRARAVAKATVHGDGTLFAAVEAAIGAISDPLTQAAAGEAWERGSIFDLDGQLVPQLVAAVGGLSEADLLNLISQAEQLPA